MPRPDAQTLAVVLIGAGLLMFLSNFGLFGALPAFIWVCLLFALGALIWTRLPERFPFWQRLVIYIAVGIFAIISADAFAATVSLGFPAMAFAFVYLRNPRNWWAIIPAGVLTSVALLVTIETLFHRWDGTAFMMLGFAATFTLLYLLPKERGGQPWALYPAILWIVLTMMINDPVGDMPSWLLPVLLIGGGAFILWRWQQHEEDS